ncbi:hypothetical protein KP509_17G045700 [Ceratopteris richardii]|uniref:Calnexin n=1 Tax=Ceratopteris richardii TaxID=49495 RepID=A0A8T2STT7_CERRI|nr:hypothetical protein KP509_17G045700 [Ceratopteris richardii]
MFIFMVGTWKHEKSQGHDDFGLLVSEKARKYGIVHELAEPVTLKKNAVVLQYDLRLQNGLECGGAYLKFLLPHEAGWDAKQFDNESPYSIMFGPDKCGGTNKVHFIFRHKNPKTGVYVEHHLKNPPSPVNDKRSHVYSAVLYPDNTLKILVDGEEKKSVNLLSSDFEPPIVPPKTIPDPDDKKPEDWDERAKIPDPDATKPDDWDEDAPMEIEDLEAEKPEGWLDDEPEEVDDPEAGKPEDWDDEEDGEWEAPKIPNPKCDEAPGCGEWKRPMKRNPAYKGKWYAPMIDNPNYKGIWKPQQIPNPEYFELEHPDLEPIGAVGIEIWTMQDGILFDNILITTDETEASKIRETTWKVKFDAEKEDETVAAPADDGIVNTYKRKVFSFARDAIEAPFLASYKPKLLELVDHGEKNANVTLGVLALILLLVLYMFYKLLCGKPAAPPVPVGREKKEDISSADDKHEESKDEDEADEPAGEIAKEDEGKSGGARRRRRRET